MSRSREALYSQSLVERLSQRSQRPSTQPSSLRLIKESLRRDLEALLNTRRHMGQALDGFEVASNSVLNYGLEDLTNIRTDPEGQLVQMQRAIHACLALYEPRLSDVSVSVQGGADLPGREIRLHIAAHLRLTPGVEIIYFNTVFDVASETYLVGQ
ncbi:type VI secretion system baseplate subunit TssE [Silvibacterium acidisoli]|uniref:type VI secretion system baseplate subunit TssE n=1 Tax=Acidobacteriaceae bacterium ZG23-2 TaxID=2883246 RepID=UPI00406C1CA0